MINSADQLLLDDSIHVVSFDVGFTLLEPYPPVGEVYSRVAARHGFDVDADWINERFYTVRKEAMERVRSGKMASFNTSEDGARAWWDSIVRGTFGDTVSEEAMPKLCRAQFEEYASSHCFRMCEGVPDILDRLREKRPDIRMIVLSNWDKRLEQVLEEIGLTKYFDRIFYSSEIGFEKPDRRTFEAVLSELNIAAKELLHVGDSRVDDVEGALNIGAKALMLRRSGTSQKNMGKVEDEPLPCPVVSSLADLLQDNSDS